MEEVTLYTEVYFGCYLKLLHPSLPLHTDADPPVTRDAPASAFECLHVSIRSMQTCACCVQEAGITETHKQSSRLSYLPLSLTPLFFLPPPSIPTSSFPFSSLCSPFLSPPSLVFFTFLPLHSLSPSLALPLSMLLSHPPCFLASYAFILLSSLALHLPSLSCFPPPFLPLPPLLSSVPCLPPSVSRPISLVPSLLFPSPLLSFLPASHHSLCLALNPTAQSFLMCILSATDSAQTSREPELASSQPRPRLRLFLWASHCLCCGGGEGC